MSRLKSRIDGLSEARRLAGCVPESITVNPWKLTLGEMTPDEIEAHKADVRRVAANPQGMLILHLGPGDAGPLAELLGPDDPLVLKLAKETPIVIKRSYG